MARGWESKSIADQMESAQTRPQRKTGIPLSADQLKVIREKENLMLSRTRVQRDLETSRNPRYVQLLTRELKTLDVKIRSLS